MASIYQLGEGFDTLWALIEEGEIPEEAIMGAFDVAKEDLADKLEGYCKFLKNLESDIAGLKAEETRLKTRRQVLENTAKKAKEAMRDAMKKAGEKKMPCGSFVCSVQENPPAVVMDVSELDYIPEKYLIPQAPTIDKKAILEDLKAGGEDATKLEGIAHMERSTSLRIR